MAKTSEFEVVSEMPTVKRGREHVETVEDRVIDALIASPDEAGVIKLPSTDVEKTRTALRYAAFRKDRSAVTRAVDGVVYVSIKPRVQREPKPSE